MEFVDILFMIVAAIIIILVLLQGGKDGASATIMGGSTQRNYANLKERGPEKVLMYLTFAMGGLFVFLAIWIRVIAK
jgi:protein translocase SecG subunit